MRYHVIPGLVPRGVCYEIRTVCDAKIHYFKDETAWSNIIGLLEIPWYKRWWFQPWMSWELEADSEQICYRVWLPSEQLGKQFAAKYYSEHPEVEISRVEDRDWTFKGPHAGTKIRMERHYVVPLKIYHNDVVDTQAELISLLEGLQAGERVRIQFLLKPAYHTNRWFQKAMANLHTEEDADPSQLTENELYKTAIQGKKARRLARVSIKVAALSTTKADARELIGAARHSFGQFSSGELNELRGREWWRILRPLFRFEFKRRIFPLERQNKGVVLSADECAMLLRLPSEKVTCNKLPRMKMRRTPLPLEVKQLSVEPGAPVVPIGIHEYHGVRTPVMFDLRGFNRHMALWGGTMMGKSTFLYNLVEEIVGKRSAENPIGFTVIDPHGSLAVDIASRIPKEQHHLIRYVRFKDGTFPFNVYDVDFAASGDKIAQNVADVCKRVWKDFWGPNVDDNFLNGGIALQRIGEASLPNLRRVLEDDSYRASVLQKLDEANPLEHQLKLFLSKYDGLDDRIKEPKINSTLNKLRKLTLSETIGGILQAESNGIRWREGMDEGYYHIFDLSGLTIDERRFIGSMCLTFAQLAMLSREDAYRSGKPMPLHPIIVDEAPTFMDQSADAIQSFADEARKYNVPLVLGMQGLEDQVPDQVASAIFRNFGTLVAYRVGNPEDAETIYEGMKHELLSESDFQRVEPNYAYIRMAIGRETTLPFLVHTNPPKEAKYMDDVPGMIAATLERAMEREYELQAARHAKEEEVEHERQAAAGLLVEPSEEAKEPGYDDLLLSLDLPPETAEDRPELIPDDSGSERMDEQESLRADDEMLLTTEDIHPLAEESPPAEMLEGASEALPSTEEETPLLDESERKELTHENTTKPDPVRDLLL